MHKLLVLALLVALAGVLGVGAVKVYNLRVATTNPAVEEKTPNSPSTIANGSVDNAAAAVTADAAAEQANSDNQPADASLYQSADDAASNMGGSYDENSF